MKCQKGFIPIIAVIVVGIIIAGGGYVVYKNKQEKNKEFVNTQDSLNKPISSTATSSKLENTPTKANTSVSTINTQLNCDGNWDCLISAASKCQSATGTISHSNKPYPLMEGFLSSGKTKYEIKKSNENCMLTYSILSQTVSLNASAKIEMQQEGMTDTEIDAELKEMNKGLILVNGQSTSCGGTNSIITTYLTNQKNGYFSGDLSFSADLNSAETTVTTSSGQKLKCSTSS